MIELDPWRMALDEEGLEGFFWPFDLNHIRGGRDRLAFAYAEALRDGLSCQSPGAEALMLASHFLVMETTGLYQAVLLASRAGGAAHWPRDSALWSAIAAKREPGLSSFQRLLLQGPNRPRGWVARGRKIVGGYLRGCRGRADQRESGGDIVATKRNDRLIVRQGELSNRDVTYTALGDWFRPIGRRWSMGGGRSALDRKLVERLLEATAAAFQAGDAPFEQHTARFLRRYLGGMAGAVGTHLARLRAKPERLPQTLWTGTGGNIWARCLRHAVREHGGAANGHDHAHGTGHFEMPCRSLVEFISCNSFITFNEAQADALRRQVEPRLQFDSSLPRIAAPAAVQGDADRGPRKGARPAQIKHIMYCGTVYDGEFVHLNPLLPDMVMIDWQARLFAQLRSWGYAVSHKPHPESRRPPPDPLQARLGATRVSGRFEEVADMADAYLFDTPASTTFGVAVQSGKPVILLDLGISQWSPEARALVAKRCALVTGRFDGQNRATIDWEEVRAAIARAPALADDGAFEQTYLGGPQ